MPTPAIDAPAEVRDRQARDRHAHRARVHRESHRGRRHVVGAGERRQDRLRREEIDHREKRGDADDERTQQRAGRVAVRGRMRGGEFVAGADHDRSDPVAVRRRTRRRPSKPPASRHNGFPPLHHVVVHLGVYREQVDGNQHRRRVAGVLPPVRRALLLGRDSPALCTIGTAQLLAYSTTSPETM